MNPAIAGVQRPPLKTQKFPFASLDFSFKIGEDKWGKKAALRREAWIV